MSISDLLSLKQKKTVQKECLISLEATENSAKSFARNIRPPSLLLLVGEMGAGKTTWLHALFIALGGKRGFSSPTYSLHHRYPLAEGPAPFREFHHLDLHRVHGEEDMESLGLWDIFRFSRGLVAIEWAEQLDFKLLPADWFLFLLHFTLLKKGERELCIYQMQGN